MTGNEKLKELISKSVLNPSGKDIEFTEKNIKKRKIVKKKELELSIIDSITDAHGNIYKKETDIISSLATFIYEYINFERNTNLSSFSNISSLLSIINEKFPKIYVKILEAYILGNHN
jgi:hypothetical protein